MTDYMTLKQIIEALSFFPKETVLINAPMGLHTYYEGNNIAMVVGETIFDMKPSSTVGSFVTTLESIIGITYPNYSMKKTLKDDFIVEDSLPLYLVAGTHKLGHKVVGITYTNQGLKLVKEEHNWR